MATHNIDDILNELGLDDVSGGARPPKRSGAPDEGKSKGHRIDKAEASFAPLPAMPSGLCPWRRTRA